MKKNTKTLTSRGLSFDIAVSEEIMNNKKIFIAQCLDFEVTTQGKTIEEAMERVKEAVSLYLEECPEERIHLKEKTEQIIMAPFTQRIFL